MIFKHHRHETKQVTQEEIPQHYQHLLIPHARHYFVEGLFGSIISQEIPAKDFVVWQHHFFIEEPCMLTAYNDTPVVTINYMLEGTPFVKLQGKHEPLLEEGTYRMFFVPPVSQVISLVPGRYHSVHISYDTDALKQKVSDYIRIRRLLGYITYGGEHIFPYLSGTNDSNTCKMIHGLFLPADNKRLEQQVDDLFIVYVRRHHTIKDDISYIEKYIRDNLKEELGADVLALHCGKSKRDFYKAFGRQYQTSPLQYIQDFRMHTSLSLLTHTNDSITDIAMMVGYNDVAYFCKLFKRALGYTPGSLREINN